MRWLTLTFSPPEMGQLHLDQNVISVILKSSASIGQKQVKDVKFQLKKTKHFGELENEK